MNKIVLIIFFLAVLMLGGIFIFSAIGPLAGPGKFPLFMLKDQKSEGYPLHRDITVTYFWIGEGATKDNDFISNRASAWDSFWQESFGGVDDPDKRNGFHPAAFTPKENPFYFALPYNDFNSDGKRKNEAFDVVYWSEEQDWQNRESMLKNRWIKIIKGDKTAYAQWEDAGPFVYDDSGYVFGTQLPANKKNDSAGLDVSPAVRDFLSLSGMDNVDWQFVREQDVPDGPWKEIITTSQVQW